LFSHTPKIAKVLFCHHKGEICGKKEVLGWKKWNNSDALSWHITHDTPPDFSENPPFPRFRRHFAITRSRFPKIGEERQVVYALVSPTSKRFFIGRTNNLSRRAGEHLKNGMNNARDEKLYISLRKHGVENFFIVPIHAVDVNPEEEEKRFIKKLCHRLIL
jgi:hypothetical protein